MRIVDRALATPPCACAELEQTSATFRGDHLNKIADRMEQHLETLAFVETLDNANRSGRRGPPICARGRPLPLFRRRAAAQEGSIGEIDHDTVANLTSSAPRRRGPDHSWNFRWLMATWKLAPALARGNCVVLNRPKQTRCPSCAGWMLTVADILAEAA